MSDCYKCKWRRSIPGDAHSECTPGYVDVTTVAILAIAKLIPVPYEDPHGVKNGWSMWPMNFDPVWIRNCPYYKAKEQNV